MTYQETLDFLFAQLPMFQREGKSAFKKDLTNTIALCKALGHPEKKFKSIHVAGTNGKGSSSHLTASILQESGLKVGLYTSPHLKSFTERIRINGLNISEQKVIDFVEEIKPIIEEVQPSFFELTVAMAFDHFAKENVDVAVIEVGLGGRLDSTNVISPEACLITNIGLDHMDMLGTTLRQISKEKAGIIKSETPVVISQKQVETSPIFLEVAQEKNAPLIFAENHFSWDVNNLLKDGKEYLHDVEIGVKGNYQRHNVIGVIALMKVLNDHQLFKVTSDQISLGLKKVVENTGLKGRWQILQQSPKVITDVGHNEDGWKFVLGQIAEETFEKLHIVLGVVKEKDLPNMLSKLPSNAYYYYCKPNVPRGLEAKILEEEAKKLGLEGIRVDDVNQAIVKAKDQANANDLIFIGGSTFVVAEVNEL
ncbi:bifunctional folylpolyglutamate synthase/dihydrofolate synthase [Flammeovirga agarivorans]|uniref:Dihydrofolate synthase/folylpolyglutamate synthase n=1 Tax=Flammeovirga agarivorans TaxID=2726742 RepID=A0A7X8XUD3_9BACT|nr:folylpolyglutamate synthase/dihydrofolate synthase family protein [Flammeovirga agarivorans]NLR90287.1 bifunctional folylpolyglutamate synthase/dihydrofolate synthase [Flammeovirga agarivorans]